MAITQSCSLPRTFHHWPHPPGISSEQNEEDLEEKTLEPPWQKIHSRVSWLYVGVESV